MYEAGVPSELAAVATRPIGLSRCLIHTGSGIFYTERVPNSRSSQLSFPQNTCGFVRFREKMLPIS
jgi:hypothetical protein